MKFINNMDKLMLSADGDIMLYEVSKNIISDFDSILEEFYNSKKTKNYDEQLFIGFLQKKFGKGSIRFIKNLGRFNSDNIPNEYKNIKWHNF